MRPKTLVTLLILLALAGPAAPVQAGGIVSICDEAHLRAALAGGGTVTFTCSGTITLIAEILIAADTTLDGSGQAVTISGSEVMRVFIVSQGVKVNLKGLTVAHLTAGDGGGIRNYGTLIVNNSIFSGNRGGDGGGIGNYGTLIVSNSTFSGNDAIAGGGIYNNTPTALGTLIVSNSTFSGNRAGEYGGGIYNNGMAIVSNSTFSGNSASWDGGGIYSNLYGTMMLKNTIVANSPTGGNCTGIISDGGGNLSYPDTTCPGIHGDPLLGPLQTTLGATETMALGPGSAAIDAGNDATCAAAPVNALDQRGIARPWGTHCDIGAVEQAPLKSQWLPTIRSQ